MDNIIIARNLSRWRVSVYECEVSGTGNVSLGRYVLGEYGRFNNRTIDTKIMPRIPNYIVKGYNYPFLVTEHRLKDESAITLHKLKARSKDDMEFSKRTADRSKKNRAIIYALGSYRILNE